MQGRIGDKNNYRKHLHMFLRKAHLYNLSRFRLGAWKLSVIMEDEEHVIFGSPEYNTCRTKYPELFNL